MEESLKLLYAARNEGMEAYADDSNSYFTFDDTGWHWRWKGSDRDVRMKDLGGVDW